VVCDSREINLGGSIEPVHNPVSIAEIAVEKGCNDFADAGLMS
jgi:hypothetical protein